MDTGKPIQDGPGINNTEFEPKSLVLPVSKQVFTSISSLFLIVVIGPMSYVCTLKVLVLKLIHRILG